MRVREIKMGKRRKSKNIEILRKRVKTLLFREFPREIHKNP